MSAFNLNASTIQLPRKLVICHNRPSNASAARTSDSLVTSVIAKRSPIHGRGVFAAKAFRKGERIIEYTGQCILWSSVPDELDDLRMYFFSIGNGERVIDPSVGGNEAQWINHSCDPNCKVRETRDEFSSMLRARFGRVKNYLTITISRPTPTSRARKRSKPKRAAAAVQKTAVAHCSRRFVVTDSSCGGGRLGCNAF